MGRSPAATTTWLPTRSTTRAPTSRTRLGSPVPPWTAKTWPGHGGPSASAPPGGPFRRWLRPRRVARPSSKQLYDDAIELFRAAYRGRPPGDAAVRALAKHLRPGQVAEGERGSLTAFTFPLGARRALDYAAFFAKGGDAELAAAKQGQARLLGECLLAANRDDWSRVADALDELADLEEQLDHAFTGGRR
jgi:hypothetical protein